MACVLPERAHATLANPAERDALVAVYNSTNGSSWSFQGTWLTGDPCDNGWYGVVCTPDRTAVRFLNLASHNLVGTLPPLDSLTRLEGVYMPSNQLTGIPTLTGLSNLRSFDVASNQLTGNLPDLTGLANFEVLNVSNNQFTGTIYPLTAFTRLNTFNVNNNQLTGTLPDLTGLAVLNVFRAENNQLTGTIPALTGLDQLRYFNVGGNQLTGNVPVAPNGLRLDVFEGTSSLCPNYLEPSTGSSNDLIWDQATGVSPWSTECTRAPAAAAPAPVPVGGVPALAVLTLLMAGVAQRLRKSKS